MLKWKVSTLTSQRLFSLQNPLCCLGSRANATQHESLQCFCSLPRVLTSFLAFSHLFSLSFASQAAHLSIHWLPTISSASLSLSSCRGAVTCLKKFNWTERCSLIWQPPAVCASKCVCVRVSVRACVCVCVFGRGDYSLCVQWSMSPHSCPTLNTRVEAFFFVIFGQGGIDTYTQLENC